MSGRERVVSFLISIQISFGSSSRGVYCVVSKTCNVMVLDVPSGLTVNVQFFFTTAIPLYLVASQYFGGEISH